MYDLTRPTTLPPYSIPKIVMNAALMEFKFNICHANVQSLCARQLSKFEEITQMLIGSKISVACFTESWLTDSIPGSMIRISGYCLIRNDRVHKRGGGIIMYVREGIRHNVVYAPVISEQSDDKTECLAVEFEVPNAKILVVAVYNPPENELSPFPRDELANVMLNYETVVLTGDLNVDWLRPSLKRDRLDNMLASFGLHVINAEPTHFHCDGCTMIDYVITNDRDNVAALNQVSVPGLSKHDLIFCSIDIDTRSQSHPITYRDYTNFDPIVLREAVEQIPWESFFSATDVESATDFFITNMTDVHNSRIPLRSVPQRTRYNAWFNDNIRRAIVERDLAYRDWKVSLPEHKEEKRNLFKRLRNRTTMLIRQAKHDRLNTYFSSSTSSGALWKKLRGLGVGRNKSQEICTFDPDEVNSTFASHFTRDDETVIPTRVDAGEGFSFHRVQDYEVVNAIFEIKSNATGSDGIPTKFLKIVTPLVINQITHLFNRIFETSTFPSQWKNAKVIPLPKKKNLRSIGNLRPISLLCGLSKALEKVMKMQITSHLDQYNLLSEQQAGFRKNQSVKTALLRVYDDIAVAVDSKQNAVLVLLDFSKAFDTISHRRLCLKLRSSFGFDQSAVSLIQSYLTGRTQTVFCGDAHSQSLPVTSGVPQGSVLGPLLFSIYINDLPNVLRYCRVQMFADDVQLTCINSGMSVEQLIQLINRDLLEVIRWARKNALQVNPTKTKVLLFGGGRSSDGLPKVNIEGSNLDFSNHANNLGVIFQSDLGWDRTVSLQCGKIYSCLRTLRTSTADLPHNIKQKLFKGLILPHFIFGDVIHFNMSAASRSKLEVALNDCVRYVFNLSRMSSVRHLQKELIGCPFRNYYNMRGCLFLFRIQKRQTPAYLFSKLLPALS